MREYKRRRLRDYQPPDRHARIDAYFAFLTVWLWVAWRERTLTARLLWLAVFLGLGSIGIALYVLTRVLPGSGRPEEVRS